MKKEMWRAPHRTPKHTHNTYLDVLAPRVEKPQLGAEACDGRDDPDSDGVGQAL